MGELGRTMTAIIRMFWAIIKLPLILIIGTVMLVVYFVAALIGLQVKAGMLNWLLTTRNPRD